jgi:CheY-like chemotaxis protein
LDLDAEFNTKELIMARILMIDDDPDVVLTVRLPLQAKGYEFHAARSSEEGLAKVKELNPDLIILDVMMETATEGFQTSLKLRDQSVDAEYAAFRDVPILMLTSVHTTTNLRFAPEEDYLPVDAFLDKSADPDQILATVAELLGRA